MIKEIDKKKDFYFLLKAFENDRNATEYFYKEIINDIFFIGLCLGIIIGIIITSIILK